MPRIPLRCISPTHTYSTLVSTLGRELPGLRLALGVGRSAVGGTTGCLWVSSWGLPMGVMAPRRQRSRAISSCNCSSSRACQFGTLAFCTDHLRMRMRHSVSPLTVSRCGHQGRHTRHSLSMLLLSPSAPFFSLQICVILLTYRPYRQGWAIREGTMREG
jgi:hypothetical protein